MRNKKMDNEDERLKEFIRTISTNSEIRSLYALGAIYKKSYEELSDCIKPDGSVDIEGCRNKFTGERNLYFEIHKGDITSKIYYILAVNCYLNLKKELIDCIYRESDNCGIITKKQREMIIEGLENLV